MLQEATLYKLLKQGYVQCTACEHFCAVEPEGMGTCGIQRSYDGALYLLVYGEAATLHVGTIEGSRSSAKIWLEISTLPIPAWTIEARWIIPKPGAREAI